MKATLTPALPTGRSERGTSGGAILGIRTRHQTTLLRHLALRESQQRGMQNDLNFVAGPIDFWDFVVMAWRLKGITLHIGIIDLTDGIGIAGTNLAKLKNLVGVLLGQGGGLDHHWGLEHQAPRDGPEWVARERGRKLGPTVRWDGDVHHRGWLHD